MTSQFLIAKPLHGHMVSRLHATRARQGENSRATKHTAATAGALAAVAAAVAAAAAEAPAIADCPVHVSLVEKPSFVGRPISTIVPDAIKTGAKDDL
uniref:Uncharacterized protein n=1 Tax=Oryza sativa subsp. japonica TaxID=39947 RepID=Q6YWJ1_ORYSJ|nr:hypothetical protein [Oryza sativa Japonica Group]BAD30818.1 hypothetical protein [Oryza sativa Japonica Group]